MIQAMEQRGAPYIAALKTVAIFRPREANQLLKRFFEKADLKLRLLALKTACLSPSFCDAQTIGDFFVKLMGASTEEEKKELIEPFIEKLLAGKSRKLAWLHAYYHGWLSER